MENLNMGDRLKALRVEHNLTQLQLAEKLDVVPSVITMYERNFRTPSLNIFINLSNLFDVSLDYLVLGKSPSNNMTADKFLKELSKEQQQEVLDFIKFLRNKNAHKISD